MNFNERLDHQIEDGNAEIAALEASMLQDMFVHIAELTDLDRLNNIIGVQHYAIEHGYSRGADNERVIQAAQVRIQEL